ncbi:hypothetical protein MKQ70_12090 [Chitinophaga sedimenti]|uniref:ligand-binding sensor domain-containing protein n=1 Tax=Chitinophaga sedimenti TaxID=2033606 RepID=UPI002004B85C|nr:two-component regulator propeller domain-containing protein [Chitinophaga sedimenti]MCK7555716.1 hypothetical protein [Chitinophaga sedimenti]
MRKVILFATFMSIALISVAGLPVRYLGIQQGLSNNAVTTIFQDTHGFMWIGTYDGLNRYDGYTFRNYRNIIGDSTSLSTNNVYSIEGDSLRRVWVGTQNGLNVFDPRTGHFSLPAYVNVKGQKGPLLGEISAIRAIDDNTVMVGSQRSGLIVFDRHEGGKQISLPGRGGNYHVHAVEYDRQRHTIWVFVEDAGLFRYDVRKQELIMEMGSIRQVNCLRPDNKGRIWMGTDTDLVLYDPATKLLTESFMPVKSPVISIAYDQQQVLWIGCDGAGVYQIAPGDAMARPFRADPNSAQISSNAVYAMYVDRENRKWIGTLRGGLNVIDPGSGAFQLVRYTGKDTRIAENFILSFCEDGDNLFIGTDGAGLRKWNRQDNTYTEYRYDPKNTASVSSNFITNLAKDAQGDIWISTWLGGVSRLKHGRQQFERFTLFNPNTQREENNAWIVYEDREKTLWASASNDGCLYRFNPAAQRFELFGPDIVNLQSIAEDNQGVLWGGTYNSLVRIDTKHKQHKVYAIHYPVRCIRETREGAFWLGTQGGGLLLFDRATGKFKQFTTVDGLPSNTILRVLEDRAGNLWLSTYSGLARFNPATKAIDLYSQQDGLQSNQFSFNGALALRSGEFVFGGINGFNLFNPDSVATEKLTPPVFLNSLKVNNRPIESLPEYIADRDQEMITHITLPFDQAVLSLDFVALDYSGADKIKYASMLEGWDKSWNFQRTIVVRGTPVCRRATTCLR